MRAYVINLEERTDRWEQVVAQQKKLGIEIQRVPATNRFEVSRKQSRYLESSVAAIALSHVKAIRLFLETPDAYCMVLEDDFLLKRNYSPEVISLATDRKFDFIQMGFLKMGIKEYFDILYCNLRDRMLKNFNVLAQIVPGTYRNFFLSKFLVREQKDIHKSIVLADIRPGAHCYLVSRKFAQAMLEINNPAFLSADLLYMSLGTLRTFKMGRLRRSLVDQSNSVSSVVNRFKSMQ
jgi:GR25 family glycosyltransferase involved in LPS biosynthesis